MAERFTLKAARHFLYGGRVRVPGELVDLDAHTAKDLLRRKSVTIPGEDEPKQAARGQVPPRQSPPVPPPARKRG